jgi:hypothetical protein
MEGSTRTAVVQKDFIGECLMCSVVGIMDVAQKVWALPLIFNLIGRCKFEKSYDYLPASRNQTFKFEQISKVRKQFSVIR